MLAQMMLGYSSMLLLFLLLLLPQFQPTFSSTVLVDGVSEWNDPTVHIGDTVVFKLKYHYSLYIFQNHKAFDLCNFNEATILSKPHIDSYTWFPSRPGFFYFCFSDGSLKSCKPLQKLAIEVSSSIVSPQASTMAPQVSNEVPPAPTPAPAPFHGGIISSSPAFPWPSQPHQSVSPSPAPAVSSPTPMPLGPDQVGGMPFINSNPAIPLPTGEVDSATIHPLPIPGNQAPMLKALLGFQITSAVLVLQIMKIEEWTSLGGV